MFEKRITLATSKIEVEIDEGEGRREKRISKRKRNTKERIDIECGD